MLVERDPHQLVEGIVIVARSRSQCNLAFVYLRGEFALGYERLDARRSPTRTRKGFLGKNILGSGFDLEHRRAPRRGRVHLRRGDRAAREARGRARHAAHPAAVPRDRRASTRSRRSSTTSRRSRRVPHIMRDGRRGVRQARRQPLDRHAHLLGLGSREASPATTRSSSACTFRDLIDGLAGGVRGGRKVKFFIPGGASSQWLTGSDEHLDAPLDMDFVQQTLGVDARLGRGHGVRRDRRPAARRVAAREVLRARVVRQVHAVPRGHGLDREGAVPHVARPRPARGPRPAPRRRRQHLARRSTRRSRRRRSARSGRASCRRVASLDKLLPRRDRASASARRERRDPRDRRHDHRRDADEPVAVDHGTDPVDRSRRRRSRSTVARRRHAASCSSRSRRSTASTSRASAGTSA